MPRLINETRDDFVRYLRRKVREQLNIEQKETKAATALAAGLTDQQLHVVTGEGESPAAFDALFAIAVEKSMNIPIRLDGKITNMADYGLIRKLRTAAEIKFSASAHVDRVSLGREFDPKTVSGFFKGFRVDQEDDFSPTTYIILCFYAKVFGHPSKTIIFPSGKLSKEKNDK